jgi:hypothetical protein
MKPMPSTKQEIDTWLYEEFYSHHCATDTCDELSSIIVGLKAKAALTDRLANVLSLAEWAGPRKDGDPTCPVCES